MKQKLTFISILLVILLAACAPAQTAATTLPVIATTTTPIASSSTVQQVEYSPVVSVDSALLATVQSDFEQIYKNVNPSVVNIQVTENTGYGSSSGEGSGFVWDTQGHIVTNNHVVENASAITVTFADGATLDAKLVGADPESDLAVIQVDASAAELRPVTLADSQAAQVGDLVIAIGNPYGLSGTMTQGIISALSRSLTVDQSNAYTTGSYTIPDIIQTDAAINPGNSGGVLVDVQGQVVGVTAAIQSTSGSNSGIGFVIPSHIVEQVVPTLITDGSYAHPRLGISGATLTPSLAQQAGLSEDLVGILVVTVTPNSPADKAGLVATTQQYTRSGQMTVSGGDVITAIDGQAVKTFDELTSYLFNSTQVGQTVQLTILRNGVEKTVQITLEATSN
ncbi:trypsin-like serine protease, typically periplasmic, contain C-terminal PDZ domain [Longilinea arvoryzae]|uniref:Trypsin-like serine protease, typically periplasmic, contain C-terminal PDZ domain n=1 Tax=Longilinea arvoryzae TaxID=360412 RepID=A0A0S7BHI3_9CHLR|nr:trypsin-like peptidase domain-containing protein [Longilinea arvoryzae]GAP13313.1 trypsin-like serine protease, typically periplasmic, contain C-terminal PDZ domain [Longilinea arvoryzae]